MIGKASGKRGKDCDKEGLQLDSVKLNSGVREQERYSEVWGKTELELAWNYPRQYQKGVSEGLVRVRWFQVLLSTCWALSRKSKVNKTSFQTALVGSE